MNPVISNQLGTRHRAAIGITEETDAIAVVVSEETGAISLAVSGKIERDLSAEDLRQRLSQLLHRYVPAMALPTPISSGAELEGNGAAAPSSRSAGSTSPQSGFNPEVER
jgi:hypothetical protein